MLHTNPIVAGDTTLRDRVSVVTGGPSRVAARGQLRALGWPRSGASAKRQATAVAAHHATWQGTGMAKAQIIDKPERAQQLARAIASDIFLYNKKKIEEGLVKDSFFADLSDEITEGRDLFRSRVTDDLFRRNYFDRAIVDRVIKPMGHVKTRVW